MLFYIESKNGFAIDANRKFTFFLLCLLLGFLFNSYIGAVSNFRLSAMIMMT